MLIIKFLISFVIFFLIQLPFILLSYPIVAVLLKTKWDGKSTWFGNELYPFGIGNSHQVENPTYYQKWQFLCIRNPVSNLGKWTLPKGIGAPLTATWPWLFDIKLIGNFYWKFGWATKPDNRINGSSRKFYFRPWFHR